MNYRVEGELIQTTISIDADKGETELAKKVTELREFANNSSDVEEAYYSMENRLHIVFNLSREDAESRVKELIDEFLALQEINN